MFRKLFRGVNKEHRKLLISFIQQIVQDHFLQAITFSCKSFDAIPVYGFFKISSAYPDTKLNGEWWVVSMECFGLVYIINTEWECGKAFSLPEQLLDQLTAFQPFVFP